MPIHLGSAKPRQVQETVKPAPEIGAELGNDKLMPHQAEIIKRALAVGKKHYKENYWDLNTGGVKCPSGDEYGPCLHRFGFGMWLDPGLGKTFTALWYDKMVREYLHEQKDERTEWPSVVLTTTSAKWQWASSEVPKWRPDLMNRAGKVMVIDGDNAVRQVQMDLMLKFKPELVILHHAQISTAVEGVFEFFRDVHILGLYVDESQYYKNWSSIRTKRLNGLQRCFTVSITGTPQSGHSNKLHPILHAIAPGTYAEIPFVPASPSNTCPLPSYLAQSFKRNGSCRGCTNYVKEENMCKYGAHVQGDADLGIKYAYTPGEFGSYRDFADKFCWVDAGRVTGSRNEKLLHTLIYDNEFAYRVTTKQVYGERNIPVMKIGLQMTPEQGELYGKIAAGLRQYFDENMEEVTERGSTFMLAMLTHARRATTLSPTAFMLAYGGHPPKWAALDKYNAKGESGKIEWALQFIQDNVLESEGNKIIIGSEWDDCLKDLEGKLEKAGLKQAAISIIEGGNALDWSIEIKDKGADYYAVINGSVPAKQRTAIQTAFNNDKRLKVLLMTQAGYEALNLTGGLEKGQKMYVTCLGVPWLPDKLYQLFGRADRLDMQGDIEVFIPVMTGTIDDMVHQTLYGKALSADRVVNGNFDENEVADKLSLKDVVSIRKLIGDYVRK